MTKVYTVHRLLRARDWQRRPEFEEVCRWWKHGGRGVFALVGIGGSGKTAIVDRFLQRLQGILASLGSFAPSRQLEAPDRLFVFSFYDEAAPDSFFQHLNKFLSPPELGATQKLSYQNVLNSLCAAGKTLLVLDGLERVQAGGTREKGFGRISDRRLRDLVLRVSDGWLPNISVLVTTRFPLFDAESERSSVFQQTEVAELELGAAIELLRDRGVRGTPSQLSSLANAYGLHALSIDLIGGYIEHFCDGEIIDSLQLTAIDMSDIDPTLDPKAASVLKQQRRFARVAHRYFSSLESQDPAALALLQRICLFRLGVNVAMLSSIFTGEEKEEVSGRHLANLTKEGIARKLHYLTRMRLLEQDHPATTEVEPTFTIHPAVRDGFLSTLDPMAAEIAHAAAREGLEEFLDVDLFETQVYTGSWGYRNLVEEIIYHSISASYVRDAWHVFTQQIDPHQLSRDGDYSRAERIYRVFAGGMSLGSFLKRRLDIDDDDIPFLDLSHRVESDFFAGWGIQVGELGGLNEAIEALSHAQNLDDVYAPPMRRRYSIYLFYYLILAGRLREGASAASDARGYAMRHGDWLGMEYANACLAFAAALLGECTQSMSTIDEVHLYHHHYHFEDEQLLFRRNAGALQLATLIQLGALDMATSLADTEVDKCKHDDSNHWFGDDKHMHAWSLLNATMALINGDFDNARSMCDVTETWALEHDTQDLICLGTWLRASIALSEAPLSRYDNELSDLHVTIDSGLKIARNCGFALCHISLLLNRAKLHLFGSNPAGALRDIELALNTDILENVESGQPALPSANRCGYVWSIAQGLHLRGEAILLQAAQAYGCPASDKKVSRFPREVNELIDTAKDSLADAMMHWRKLRVQTVSNNNNFLHPDTGVDYNYQAESTYEVLANLAKGKLTTYPLQPMSEQTSCNQGRDLDSRPSNVFFSYAHEDETLKQKLVNHLTMLKRESVIEGWDDRMIKAGDEWEGEINDKLESADIILLLISSDFLASDYCFDVEMARAIELHDQGKVTIIPIILRPVDWENAPFSRFQALPKDARPVTEWENEDSAFANVAQGIRRCVESK